MAEEDRGREALAGNVVDKVNQALGEYLNNLPPGSVPDQLGLSQALVKGGFIEMVTQGYRGEKIQLRTSASELFTINNGQTLGVESTESPSGTVLRQPSSMSTMKETTGKIINHIKNGGKLGAIQFIHGPK